MSSWPFHVYFIYIIIITIIDYYWPGKSKKKHKRQTFQNVAILIKIRGDMCRFSVRHYRNDCLVGLRSLCTHDFTRKEAIAEKSFAIRIKERCSWLIDENVFCGVGGFSKNRSRLSHRSLNSQRQIWHLAYFHPFWRFIAIRQNSFVRRLRLLYKLIYLFIFKIYSSETSLKGNDSR